MLQELDHLEYSQRLVHINALEEAGINPFPAEPPKRSHKNAELIKNSENLSGSVVSVVGRMISKRIHGGLTFAHIEDESGAIQTVMQRNKLGDLYPIIRDNFGIGDFVGATGILRATQTGEISVWAEEMTMLAKALRVVPHRITDPEIQQRQRYLHTLSDVEARKNFRVRSQIVQSMREYFIGRLGCLEVETPILDSTYGGATAKPFITHHNALDQDFFLRIANELYLKRMTVGGYYEGVFEFSRDFRNEGMDKTHNPEFTQVELYKPWWDYYNMMDMTEELIGGVEEHMHGDVLSPFNGQMIDYSRPWRRLTIYDGIRQKLGIHPENTAVEELQKAGRELGLQIEGTTKGSVCVELFEQLWENELINPTFVMDFPTDTSALTKRHRLNPELTERFELFVGGMEIANCYTELNDPRDQRARFELEKQKRQAGDVEAMPYDEDFIRALEYGMPPQAGIGISIDRLTMLLTNINHIRQAIYFPTLRRVKDNG
ncbi:MAG: lysine--tRNA ligase [Candidatus Daviesbacteria bacterium]|nr:lysine--tRNA ligase [Candidatus Daviesbacteria bacterium]